MPTATYIPLATITLGSNASTVTFSNIPTTGYRDLILVGVSAVTGQRDIVVSLNSDTTAANYPQVSMAGTGSSAVSGTFTRIGILVGFGNVSGQRSQFMMNLMDYSATDKHKTTLTRWNNIDDSTQAVAGRWANTAAVTSLTIRTTNFSSGDLASGATFSLYGIAG